MLIGCLVQRPKVNGRPAPLAIRLPTRVFDMLEAAPLSWVVDDGSSLASSAASTAAAYCWYPVLPYIEGPDIPGDFPADFPLFRSMESGQPLGPVGRGRAHCELSCAPAAVGALPSPGFQTLRRKCRHASLAGGFLSISISLCFFSSKLNQVRYLFPW